MKRGQRIGAIVASIALAASFSAVLGGLNAASAASEGAEAGFGFATEVLEVGESEASARIEILRLGSPTVAATVHFETEEGGSADPGIDFQTVSGEVEIEPGARSAVVYIPILADFLGEEDETVKLSLSSPPGAPSARYDSATLKIVDDDKGIALASGVFFSSEGDGAALIAIRRLGVLEDAGSVQLQVSDLTAVSQADHGGASQTVVFEPGARSIFVSIPILDDQLTEADETIKLTLSDPSEGTILQDPSVGILTIYDNDKPQAAKRSPGRIVSARLTKSRLALAEAGLVRLLYSFHPRSEVFNYALSVRSDSGRWRLVRNQKKKGSFAGKHALTVKRLFGPKPVLRGSYRLKLSADENSKTLRFTVK